MENFKDEIVDIVTSYYHINQQMRKVESELIKLKSIHQQLKDRKDELCEKEDFLINKIEEELGRKVTLTELYQMLISPEKA